MPSSSRAIPVTLGDRLSVPRRCWEWLQALWGLRRLLLPSLCNLSVVDNCVPDAAADGGSGAPLPRNKKNREDEMVHVLTDQVAA